MSVVWQRRDVLYYNMCIVQSMLVAKSLAETSRCFCNLDIRATVLILLMWHLKRVRFVILCWGKTFFTSSGLPISGGNVIRLLKCLRPFSLRKCVITCTEAQLRLRQQKIYPEAPSQMSRLFWSRLKPMTCSLWLTSKMIPFFEAGWVFLFPSVLQIISSRPLEETKFFYLQSGTRMRTTSYPSIYTHSYMYLDGSTVESCGLPVIIPEPEGRTTLWPHWIALDGNVSGNN